MIIPYNELVVKIGPDFNVRPRNQVKPLSQQKAVLDILWCMQIVITFFENRDQLALT